MKPAELEEKIIKNWREIKAFEKSVEKRPKNRSFVFYEGPPTANGRPGLHHVEARSFKDVICRYKTMQGHRVERRAGWDTHGLPVELEVEKKLGLKSKKDIEEYGIEKFNEKCKESVWEYKNEWERLTERMGFWIDTDNPYITYDPLYMESLWWIIKQASEKDLLYEGHKVVPRCSRCGTGLSSHEVSQGYKEISEDSVFVKFQILNPKSETNSSPEANQPLAEKFEITEKSKIFLLAWTTTPWTLPGNVALAVGESIKYQVLRIKESEEIYILAEELVDQVLDTEYDILNTVFGRDLVGIEYEPLFDIKELQNNKSYKVYAADFVSTENGTGIVHTAVMYGEDDYVLGDKLGLPKIHTVDDNGKFTGLVKEFEGQFVKDAEPGIITLLKSQNKLYKKERYEHSYPFCWRCGTPLLYYAMHSWFVSMKKLKKNLIDANNKVNWVPEYIKEGRFGEWLDNVKDWAFSRSRYWGTPLPVWKCSDCDHVEVVGSKEELSKLAKGKNEYWLLRHGHSGNNEANILVSDPSTEHPLDTLSAKGKKQVTEAAKELKKQGGVDIIIASPLGRTSETAEAVGKELGIEVVYEEGIKELDIGIYEGKHEHDYAGEFKAEKDYNFTKRVPQGETLAEVRRRMLEVVYDLEEKHQGKKVLIVSHGHPIWVLETAMLGLTIKESAERKKKGDYPQNAQLRKVEYSRLPYNVTDGELDFHRPYVDWIEFDCTKCKKGKMKRIEEVADVWFDSGSMPFAQAHYPFENKDKVDSGKAFPADYITEAIDQTRGWFYTLLAVSAILEKAPAYKNVISLGHVLDEKGQKMSKSKGNIVNPWDLSEKYGMDAVRWYFFTVNQPGDPKRFSEGDVRERWQKFVSTYINSFSFLKLYTDNTKPPKSFSEKSSSNVLDKWIHARFKEVAREATRYIEEYNVLDATRAIDSFVVDDLSNWHIRRSRPRLQKPADKKEKEEAVKTLSFILNELSKLTAPFVPFSSEHVWQGINGTTAKSVHWEKYPSPKDLTATEKEILELMKKTREFAQAGLSARSVSSLKIRQPLQALAIPEDIPDAYKRILEEELNVKEVLWAENINDLKEDKWFKHEQVALNTELSDALREEGYAREVVRSIQNMRKSLKMTPKDKISVQYSLPSEMQGKLSRFEDQVAGDVNASKFFEKELSDSSYDAKSLVKLDGKHEVEIGIKRV
ncbi:MAG: class I tRNA ligase family protein [Candidatus Spechtbacterales bacterium]